MAAKGGTALSKDDILTYGPQFLKDRKRFCDCSTVDKKILCFALKCITDLLRERKHLKMTPKDTNNMKEILTPYKRKYLALSSPSRRGHYMRQLRKQRGGGVFTSILAAVVPVIASLISKLLNKGKKK